MKVLAGKQTPMERSKRSLKGRTAVKVAACCGILLLLSTVSGVTRPSLKEPQESEAPTPQYARQLSDVELLEERVSLPAQTYGWVPRTPTPDLDRGSSAKVWDCISYVNVKYRYVFVKQFKTGSTTTRRLFTECKEDGSGEPWCMSALGPVADEVARNLSEYTVFTTVRSPYTRAISNYNYLLLKMSNAPQCTGIDWDEFCQNPYSLADVAQEYPECAVARSQGEMRAHVHRQASCLVDNSGNWIVDFIARMEELETDLAAVVERLNERRSEGLPPIVLQPMRTVNPTNVCSEDPPPKTVYKGNGTAVELQIPPERYCNASSYFGPRHPHCMMAVAQHYRADLDVLYPSP